MLDRSQTTGVIIDDFISLFVDYRPIGNQNAQMTCLQKDYESVGWKALQTGEREEVDQAFRDYLLLIRSGYALNVSTKEPP